MLVKINSSHPDFLSILRKNPESFEGLQLRQIKNGTGIGFVSSPSEYHLIFQDTKYSFSEKDHSNQIDFMSYCHPRVFLTLASELLREPLVEKSKWFNEKIPWLNKTVSELDVSGYLHTLEIENIYVDGISNQREFIFTKYFPEVTLIHKSGCLYTLKIETTESIHRLVNLAALTCMYLSAVNKQNWFLNTDLVKKYIRIMKNLDPVPYFIIYLFTKSCIRSHEEFNLLKPELNAIFKGELDLTWGNTQEMRLRTIGEKLMVDGKIKNHILEVGCGEMDYAWRFMRKMEGERIWYATDVQNYGHLVSPINKRHKYPALRFIQQPEEIEIADSNELIILMVEVIEHMPLEDSKKMVRSYIDKYSPPKILITTPNFNFNRHFGLEGFRHDDHHFELTTQQFSDYISEVLDGTHYYAEFFGIGDKVDGDYLSLGVELRSLDYVY